MASNHTILQSESLSLPAHGLSISNQLIIMKRMHFSISAKRWLKNVNGLRMDFYRTKLLQSFFVSNVTFSKKKRACIARSLCISRTTPCLKKCQSIYCKFDPYFQEYDVAEQKPRKPATIGYVSLALNTKHCNYKINYIISLTGNNYNFPITVSDTMQTIYPDVTA